MAVPYQQFDLSALKQDFSNERRTRIDNVFEGEFAAKLARHIHSDLSFVNAYIQDGQYKTISNQALKDLPVTEQREFFKQLYANAAQGVGFFYGRHQMTLTPENKTLSQQVHHWLNSPQMLDSIKSITGYQDIEATSAQVTRYTPGHFLTRHNDVHESEQRRVAYVLNLTPEWHPDWGGLLQFYERDGTPKDAWIPKFNSLALFDVNNIHAVTYVTPFALQPRLSVTGWFRATPL